MIRRIIFYTLCLLVTLPAAFSEERPEAGRILSRVAEALHPPTDVRMTQRMTLVTPGGSTITRQMEQYQRRDDALLVRYISPDELSGITLLVTTRESQGDLVYLYLPAELNGRLVDPEVWHHEFTGTDLTYGNFAHLSFEKQYRVLGASEEESSWTLILEPTRADSYYSAVLMDIDRKSFLPREVRLYHEGHLEKRIRTERIVYHQGYPVPMRTVVETVRSGHRTVIEVVDVEHLRTIPDSVFSVASLRHQR